MIRERPHREMATGRRATEIALTTPAQSSTPPAADARAAVAVLRRAGHRVSASRRQVLEALYAADAPVSAEEIASGLGGRVPPSDLSTVYRTLELLGRLGLTRHVHLGHGPSRYLPTAAGERDYFLCERCGEVRAADPRALRPVRDAIARAFGWRVRFSHFPIAGLCPRCAGEEPCSD